jgi:hypothetical protein
MVEFRPAGSIHQEVNDYLGYDTPVEAFVKWLTIEQVMNIDAQAAGGGTMLPALAELPGHLVWRARAKVVAALEEATRTRCCWRWREARPGRSAPWPTQWL